MAREIGEEYLSSLQDLNVNNKPLIDMLTIIAEENQKHAPVIVDAIMQHIDKVPPTIKLPILYLIDSIVKNVGEDYKTLFSKHIVTIFVGVFEKVNEKVREKMYVLRQTWNDIFLPTKLYALDVKVNSIDPNWPITAKISKNPVIHVNPNFWKKKITDASSAPAAAAMESLEEMNAKLEEKNRELLVLKKCKLELELMATKKKIEEEEKRLSQQAQLVKTVPPPTTMTGPGGSKVKVSPVGTNLLTAVKSRDPRQNRNGKDQSLEAMEKKSAMDQSEKEMKMSKSPKKSSSSKSSSTTGSKSKGHSSSKSPNLKGSNRHKEKSSGISPDKKRLSGQRTSTAIGTEKSPKRSRTETAAANVEGESPSKVKFKDMKPSTTSSGSIKNRNYRNNHGAEEEKIVGLDEENVEMVEMQQENTNRYQRSGKSSLESSPLKRPIDDSCSTTANQKKILDAASKDIDLRQFPVGPITQPPPQLLLDPHHHQQQQQMDLVSDSVLEDLNAKKRISPGDIVNSDEPFAKKSKSEKFDLLFGSNDVDLRSISSSVKPLSPIHSGIGDMEKEPQSGWSKLKGDSPNKSALPNPLKTNFETLRSRIQQVGKIKKKRFEDRIIPGVAPPPIGDVDFRNPPPIIDENSQDQTDNNIKIIMVQAQEQYENKNIDLDQYNNMVKQVIQLSETQKIKEAERRESLSNLKQGNNWSNSNGTEQSPKEDPRFSSESDEEEEKNNFRNRRNRKSHFQNRREEGGFGGVAQNAGDPRRMNRPTHWDARGQNMWRPGGPPNQFNNRNNNPWQMQGNNNNNMFEPNQGQGPQPRFTRFSNNPNFNPMPQPLIMAAPLKTPQEKLLTIKIDNIAREIRFYDDVAIVFMNWDQPREIGFQPGQRRVTCDDRDPIVLHFNAINSPWLIDGVPHQVRLGVPTRELYLDNKWYECYFGDPIRVDIDGKMRTINIDAPPPQVRIGNPRTDLVMGKINLIIDAKLMVSVFLDGKEQLFELDGAIHTIQFADYLLSVLINKEPYLVEFGGLPKSFYVGGQKHFIRFTALPNGVVPGKCFIQNMPRTALHLDMVSPPPPPVNPGPVVPVFQPSIPPPNMAIQPKTNGIDMLTNILASVTNSTTNMGYNQEMDLNPTVPPPNIEKVPAPSVSPTQNSTPAAVPTESTSSAPNVNIDDLFQKLLASGILKNTTTKSTANESKPGQEKKAEEEQQEDSKVVPTLPREKVIPVNLLQPETIKQRQAAIVDQIYCGMQCSSCGVRFPPEQTMKYSQHLDWHFRQNRRDRDSARRAHSRKWYYEVADWVQYEEIEDLEEREKNWFETQQSEMDIGQDDSNQNGETTQPSCPAGSDSGANICDVCHDPFDQFYHEETEEWHLRPAIRVEEKTYHPLCYEDYKASLTLDETAMAESLEESKNENGDVSADNVVIKQEKTEGDKDVLPLLLADDDDDDVIVLPSEAQIVTEILDDDDEIGGPTGAEGGKSDESKEKSLNESRGNESDVEIQEPHIPIQNLVDMDDSLSVPCEGEIVMPVQIKIEREDDTFNEEDAFMDVGTFEPHDEEDEEATGVEEVGDEDDVRMTYSPQPVQSAATYDPLKTNIDGNVDISESQQIIPIASKIKINISKLATTSSQPPETANTESRDSINSAESTKEVDEASKDSEGARKEERPEEVELEFVYKESMKGVEFRKTPKFASGIETSGLCSIM